MTATLTTTNAPDHAADRKVAKGWAEYTLNMPYAIIDTETTGADALDEVVEVAVLTSDGEEWCTKVRPTVPIAADAEAIHGISDLQLSDAPSFADVFTDLLKVVGTREVIIYNVPFDLRIIEQSLAAHGVPFLFGQHKSGRRLWPSGAGCRDAMLWYSQYVGEWNAKYCNYKWQKLPSGDHTALGDCQAVEELLQRMARGE